MYIPISFLTSITAGLANFNPQEGHIIH
jgi:hypothetical protein